MDESDVTNKFSICLIPDTATERAVYDIRQVLPPAPLRDDKPHLTLLRTIKTPQQTSDSDLLQGMEQLLELTKTLPLEATVQRLGNVYSPLFGMSSLVLLSASPEMLAYHKQVKKILKHNGYSVGLFAQLLFAPHVSVRLGVPYNQQARALTEKYFVPGAKISFGKWMILRDIKKDGKYIVKEIALSSRAK